MLFRLASLACRAIQPRLIALPEICLRFARDCRNKMRILNKIHDTCMINKFRKLLTKKNLFKKFVNIKYKPKPTIHLLVIEIQENCQHPWILKKKSIHARIHRCCELILLLFYSLLLSLLCDTTTS